MKCQNSAWRFKKKKKECKNKNTVQYGCCVLAVGRERANYYQLPYEFAHS